MEPDYNNPTQEMIDSIGVGSLPSDIEEGMTESFWYRLEEDFGIKREDFTRNP